MGEMYILTDILIIFGLIGIVCSAQHNVLELDDSFLENRGEHAWLIMFYAPWCGHCRRLEPVWSEVNTYLKEANSPVHTAKLDATRFSSVASHFDVHGYPAIKFIQGDRVLTYKGDRLRESIVEFANRAHGPAVRWLSSFGKLQDVISELGDGVFFLYIGSKDENSELYRTYEEVATAYQVHSYFYAGASSILPPNIETKQESVVFVFKDGKHYEFEVPSGGPVKESLEAFVSSERHAAFPKLTSSGLYDLSGLKKKIVMFVTENGPENQNGDRIREFGAVLATQYRDTYHRHFQFVWMDDPEASNSITMSHPETPYILVWQMETNLYYLPETGFNVDQITLDDIRKFLNDVISEKSVPLGGNSIGQRIKRFFYDIGVVIYSIYNESVWLALVIFGVPSLVIGIISYALCCMETVDDDFYDESEQMGDGMDASEGDKEKYQKQLPANTNLHKKSD